MFSLWCIDWVGSFYTNRILIFFFFLYWELHPDPGWLAGRKSALTPLQTPLSPTPPRWFILLTVLAVVPVLTLLFVALWFILWGDLFYVLPCVIMFLCFSVLTIVERAIPGVFRTFVRFALVWFCLFPLPLGVWDWLRFVLVALPGLFSYPFISHIANDALNNWGQVYWLWYTFTRFLKGGEFLDLYRNVIYQGREFQSSNNRFLSSPHFVSSAFILLLLFLF